MTRYIVAGGILIAAAAVIFAWGLCRAAAVDRPRPDPADECPDFIEPADDAEDAEWLMLMAVVEDDWSAWEAEVSA